MPTSSSKKAVKPKVPPLPKTQDDAAERAQSAIERLKQLGTKAGRDGMARYAIPSEKAFGVAMRDIQALAKELGRDHALAAALWKSGWYEARTLAAYVEDSSQVTAAQMEAWCGEFDNWAICDTVCFALFDRTPHAWEKVDAWAAREEEFVKRAAFALLWGLTVHDKAALDTAFIRRLRFVLSAAADERNFVKKAVNMALRAVGKRNAALHQEAVKVAEKLAASANASAKWVGKDALRELASAAVLKRVSGKKG